MDWATGTFDGVELDSLHPATRTIIALAINKNAIHKVSLFTVCPPHIQIIRHYNF